MTKQEFQQRMAQGPLILDGATGSNLLKSGMPRGVCTEQWISAHPDPLIRLQKAYIEAGSHVVYAPTFLANPVSLGSHHLAHETKHLNHELVRISRQAANGKALVAGDISTTGKLMEPMGEMPYDTLFEAYKEQITYLVEAGVDLLVAETMMATDETMVVLDAASEVCDLPVLCSLTIESDGGLFFGGNIYEAVEALEAVGAAAIGCNCSVGPDQLESVISEIYQRVSIPVIAKPNAGMPKITATGEAVYSMEPEEFAKHMEILAKSGASLLGGCCGTDPRYIQALCQKIKL